jgi:catecholate siderophore receptor
MIRFSGCHLVLAIAGTTVSSYAASLTGNILDAAHMPVPAATVTLACANAPAQTVSSGPTGQYSIPFSLRSRGSACTLRAGHAGFIEVTVPLTVDPDASLERDIVLRVAPMSTAVTVSEDAGYLSPAVHSATKTLTALRDVPQSISVVNREQMDDQLLSSVADAVRYVPGVMSIQGENNRDQLVIRGNSTSADFFLDGIRDDVQYYRDLYNLDRVEVLKGPNAMIFGRGGGGGVVNRATKEPSGSAHREFAFDGGSFGDKRFTLDLDQPLGKLWAGRLNGVYENSGSFRDHVGLERWGVDPSLSYAPSGSTRLTLNFESFRDHRTADRGVPSFNGRPLDVPAGQYFGDPDSSPVRASVNTGSVAFEHHWANVEFHDRTLIGDYDRGYQNFVPGIVNATKTLDSLSAYNNATHRRNMFNQADLSGTWKTGLVRHRWVAGVEFGHQSTANFRNTGYFNNAATSIQVPLDDTVITTKVVFRQSATDADNHLVATVAAGYVQDQIELTRHLQFLVGLRFDSFRLRYHDNRSGVDLERPDHLLSPRAGLVFKPVTAISIYGSYSVSYLPSSGDQFSSLTTITQQVKPEKFNNLEAGIKWDIRRGLSASAAVYRLDRNNTRSTDPNDPTRIVQTGSQRTNGGELSLTGNLTRRWSVIGGFGRQHAFVTSPTTAAVAGAIVAQVPRNTFTLWNRYMVTTRLSAGFGLIDRSSMFAAIDDAVVLPGYMRADAAVYYSLTERVRLQTNVENLFNTRYTLNADNNNNLSPGSPRSVRIGVIARF